MKPRRRRLLRAVLIVAAVLGLGLTLALATIDRWLMRVLDPGSFDAARTPAAPDYGAPAAWAAHPGAEDSADVALPELPAIDQARAPADVFYVHPTTWLGGSWNGPIDDPGVVEATSRGGTLIQASAYNACCAVYAPRYRQAHGHAFVRPSPAGDRAIDIAFTDISAAFDHFVKNTAHRPFIVAGHSQGAILAARLLRERIAGQPLSARLVAAYLPGAPIREGTIGPGIPLCRAPLQTGCYATWNARGPKYVPNGLELDADNPGTMIGRACVNPITWMADEEHAPAAKSRGALFFDTEAPALQPAFADARCKGGVLVVTAMGDLRRDFMSKLLLWSTGPENYHPIEYQLFYADLRKNAADRVEAFLAPSKSDSGQ